MKLFLIGIFGVGFGLAAQAPQAAVRIGAPSTAGRATEPRNAVGTAVLGFVTGPGPAELSAILGVFGAARIGEAVAVPETVTRLYLSTPQRYALVEQNSSGPLAVWRLDETALVNNTATNSGFATIAGALPHPDMVAFSPRGDSVALYARTSGQIQVISGMPNQPSIRKTTPPASAGTITMIALSDDASVLVIRDSMGDARISTGGDWQPFYDAYSPSAWAFVPKTHNLVIGDSQENALFLVEQAGSKNTRMILAENCSADQVGVTGDGETLVALDSRRSIVWTVDLKRRIANITTAAEALNSLAMLRGGNTFVASSSNADATLLKISEAGTVQISVIHATREVSGH